MQAAANRTKQNQHEALELALRDVSLDPGHRQALICLAQIRVGLGQPAATVDIFARVEPPPADAITKPARSMRDSLSEAKRHRVVPSRVACSGASRTRRKAW
ncbi:hypothetical protein O9K51_10686 [Purpureocillium lavendulum]|uniref:Uncharacterized protein n=1 Tax=Purpureocillium lavendulum TaxID=1247861 RepID=A0AB34FCX0_9HYPO|nr:hypothetical protein O9K51_10686 [Purpureocillium lavendulum]